LILWHAGLALAIVWNVFRDGALDHRLVLIGALVPDGLDLASGRPAHAHTLAAAVLVLFGVMLFTRGRRATRRRLLGLPIGMFLHLLLDGIWTKPHVLWWPFFGTDFAPGGLVPPLPLALAEELVGAWALAWFVWRFGLADRTRRRKFLRTGRVEVAP